MKTIFINKWTCIIFWLSPIRATAVFSLGNHLPHAPTHVGGPRRLDTNKVNVFHPFGDSDLSQDEQITNQEHQLHPELCDQGSGF